MSKNIRAELLAINVATVAMSGMLNAPKKIDELKLCVAQVKDKVAYDFNGKKLWNVNCDDIEIFSIEKVNKTQAVTVALKRDYTLALMAWGTSLTGDANEKTEPEAEDESAPVSKENKGKKSKKVSEKEVKEDEVTPEFNLKDEIKNLVHLGKLKKAKKLIGDNENHPDFKKAKKILKKASK